MLTETEIEDVTERVAQAIMSCDAAGSIRHSAARVVAREAMRAMHDWVMELAAADPVTREAFLKAIYPPVCVTYDSQGNPYMAYRTHERDL